MKTTVDEGLKDVKEEVASSNTKMDTVNTKMDTVVAMLTEIQATKENKENDPKNGNSSNVSVADFHELTKQFLPVGSETVSKTGWELAIKSYSTSGGAIRINELLRQDHAMVMNYRLHLHCESKDFRQLQDTPSQTVVDINEILYAMRTKRLKRHFNKKKKESEHKIVYRVTGELPDSIAVSKGKIFMDKAFLSTSKKYNIWSKKKDEICYLFEIECRFEGNAFDISSNSDYGEEEEEVLFYPGTAFEILQVEELNHHSVYGQVTKVTMKEL